MSDLGHGSVSLDWTPPDELTIVTMTILSGYDVVDEANQVAVDVPIAKWFGNENEASLMGFGGPTTMFAVPITRASRCRVIDSSAGISWRGR